MRPCKIEINVDGPIEVSHSRAHQRVTKARMRYLPISLFEDCETGTPAVLLGAGPQPHDKRKTPTLPIGRTSVSGFLDMITDPGVNGAGLIEIPVRRCPKCGLFPSIPRPGYIALHSPDIQISGDGLTPQHEHARLLGTMDPRINLTPSCIHIGRLTSELEHPNMGSRI